MKIKLEKIIAKLEEFCSPTLALADDSCGWQIKTNQETIKKIILALDPSWRVINQAVERKCQLLLTHHPLFWPKEQLEKDPIQTAKGKVLQAKKINHYNLHTNYDQKYLNYLFAQKSLNQLGKVKNCQGYALVILKQPLNWKTIWQEMKKNLQLQGCQSWQKPGKKLITKLAFVAGGGGFFLRSIREKKIDLFITGEMKWNQWMLAKDYQQSVVTVGHHLEELFILDLKNQLKKWFPQITILEHWEKSLNYQ